MCASSLIKDRRAEESDPAIGKCLPQFSHINRYVDNTNDCIAAKLLPGDYYVTTRKDEMITTVLGSCIAACIYDVKTGYGGMNHFMLPEGSKSDDGCTRFGINAMERMINDLLKCGSRRENIRAKVFGGGNVLKRKTNVGQRNIDFVREYLAAEQLPIESADVGLIYPRKVNFYPGTGKVMVKRLRSLHNNTIEKREAKYRSQLEVEKRASGEIELF